MQSLAAAQGCPTFTVPRVAPFKPASRQRRPLLSVQTTAVYSEDADVAGDSLPRRVALQGLVMAAATLCLAPAAVAANEFVQTPSGLLIQDITVGTGRVPQPGELVSVHWAGYTKNYQAKRLDNTSRRDEPYIFTLGAKEAIPAFEEAVSSMRVGGVRRIEVLGEIPSLSYPRDRAERFVSGFTYRYGPQPAELGGKRALDFVLDNGTLSATNRTLLFDIRLLSTRSK